MSVLNNMENQKCTIIIFSENKPGVLYRVADLFLRRKVNIESLHVAETETRGISKFTIVIKQDRTSALKTINQLNKIIEITNAHIEE